MLRLYMPSVICTKGTRLSELLLLLLHPKSLHRSYIDRFKIQNTVDSNEGDLSPPTLQTIYFSKWMKTWNQVNLAWICSILICKTSINAPCSTALTVQLPVHSGNLDEYYAWCWPGSWRHRAIMGHAIHFIPYTYPWRTTPRIPRASTLLYNPW